jgi:hypothetical protein
MASEAPKSNELLEDRKPQKVATPQRERGKKELAPRNDGASFSFPRWGKKKK